MERVDHEFSARRCRVDVQACRSRRCTRRCTQEGVELFLCSRSLCPICIFSFLLFAQFEFAFAFIFILLFPSAPPFVAGPAQTVASGRSISAPLSAVYSRQRPLRRAAASPWLALKIWTSFCGCTAMCVFLTLRRHRRTTEGRFISPAAATLCANRAYATVRKLHHL